MDKRIIGLAGTFASGKDSLAHFLVNDYNFMHLSTGDIFRQEALRLRNSIERPVLFEVANQLRKERGADVVIQIALEMFHAHQEKYQGVVISGVRSIGEVETIKAKGGTMVFVDAPVEIRYQRMASRRRDSEALVSLEEFKAGEEKESKVDPNDKAIQNLAAMREMADVTLVNGSSLEEFLQSAIQALALSEK